jgi:hypothetical protein
MGLLVTSVTQRWFSSVPGATPRRIGEMANCGWPRNAAAALFAKMALVMGLQAPVGSPDDLSQNSTTGGFGGVIPLESDRVTARMVPGDELPKVEEGRRTAPGEPVNPVGTGSDAGVVVQTGVVPLQVIVCSTSVPPVDRYTSDKA